MRGESLVVRVLIKVLFWIVKTPETNISTF